MSNLDTGTFTNTLTGRVTFGPMSPSCRIVLPVNNWPGVKDVQLALWSDISTFTSSAASDVHVYLTDYNLTRHIVRAIKEALADPMQIEKLKRQYHAALDRWIEVEKQMGDAFSIPVDRDQHIALKLKNESQLSKLMRQLGDSMLGWGGNLHLFNYIYTDVSIQPVSLSAVLEEYFSENPKVPRRQLQDINPCFLTFASGTMNAHSDGSVNAVSQGAVSYRLEILYTNPADSALNAIWGAVNSDSVLATSVNEILGQINVIQQNLDKYDRELGDPKIVGALEQTIQELKRNFKAP